MNETTQTKKYSAWSILAGCSLGCSLWTLYKGIDKMTNYYNSENFSSLNKNAYVGGDAYNYIINGNYATAFFVLTAMFVLAAIGLMVLHYVSRYTQQQITSDVIQEKQVSPKTVLEDIESNLPQI